MPDTPPVLSLLWVDPATGERRSIPLAELRAGSKVPVGDVEVTVGYPGDSTRTLSGSSRIVVPPTLRRPPAAAHRAPLPPDRRPIAFALAGGGLVAVLAAAAWFLALRPRSAPPVPAPAPVAARVAVPVPTATAIPAPTAPEDPFAAAKKSVVTVIAKLAFEKGFATGTGFFVTTSGKVLTNYHVVRRTDYQQVLLPGRKKPVDAHILAKDEEHDLALLQAMVEPPVPVAPLAEQSALKMGDSVFALGSPAGPVLEMSLSRGIISADKPRAFGDVSFLQHDAAINPGNSGGPLLDQKGRVIGVNTLKIRETQGLSFAIPIEDVRLFLETTR